MARRVGSQKFKILNCVVDRRHSPVPCQLLRTKVQPSQLHCWQPLLPLLDTYKDLIWLINLM